MKEYKIYTAYASGTLGENTNMDIEQKLNVFAKQGYHVISTTCMSEYCLVFTLERNIPDEE